MTELMGLISVRQFRDDALALMRESVPAPEEGTADIRVADIAVPTIHNAIRDAIAEEVERVVAAQAAQSAPEPHAASELEHQGDAVPAAAAAASNEGDDDDDDGGAASTVTTEDGKRRRKKRRWHAIEGQSSRPARATPKRDGRRAAQRPDQAVLDLVDKDAVPEAAALRATMSAATAELHSAREGIGLQRNPHRREVNFISPMLQRPGRVLVPPFKLADAYIAEPSGPDPVEAIPADAHEVIVTVAVYHPVRPIKQQEFRCLGSQLLTALKDRLYCVGDHTLDGVKCQSGYFFIENTFYSDTRGAEREDYAAPIISWARDRGLEDQYGKLAIRKMEETTFLDLDLRIGAPYLWVHQGCCEHTIMFTDVRLMHDDDSDNRLAYPMLVFEGAIRVRRCRICDVYSARWVTFEDKLAPDNPTFFCERCYRGFHYSADGKLLYHYYVFPYFHE